MRGWRIEVGDCREVLRTIPDGSVQTCVTSPPYWGLRDYGTATWDGGDAGCDHRQPATGGNPEQGPNKGNNNCDAAPYRSVCGKCGARRIDSQLGLERTPEEYVEAMVGVFREVRRVLADDGTLWCNLGDSYASSPASGGSIPSNLNAKRASDGSLHPDGKSQNATPKRAYVRPTGLKPKDLVGIPWRVAFALQADGWVLRSEIIWAKPNPMPESVTDRPTKAHEQLFLFSKARRSGPEPSRYDDIPEGEARWLAALFDGEGSLVCRREADHGDEYGAHAAQVSVGGTSQALIERLAAVVGEGNVLQRPGENAPMHYWQTSGKRALGLLRRIYPFLVVKQRQARCLIALEERKQVRGGHARLGRAEIEARDRIWNAVKALNHFGDPDLTEIPEPTLGRWGAGERYYYDAKAIEEASAYGPRTCPEGAGNHLRADSANDMRTRPRHAIEVGETRNRRSVWTIATQPFSGAHFAVMPQALVEPCILAGSREGDLVLDPFAGAGTVGVVARKHSRRFLGIELNPAYAQMAGGRLGADLTAEIPEDAPLFQWGGA